MTNHRQQIHPTFPADIVPSLNKMYAANQYKRASIARESHQAVSLLVMAALGLNIVPLEGPVIVTITAFEDHPRDPDNIAKALLDGLVISGVLKTDDWKYITELRLRSRKDRTNQRIEVSITEAG